MFSRKKSFDFFSSFHEFSRYAVLAADYLMEVVSNFNIEELASKKEGIHKIESDCDLHKKNVNAQLFREFLPPIDAEDIVELNHLLDNVVDSIEEILVTFYIFNIKEIRPQAVLFSKIIADLAQALHAATEEFKDFKKSKILPQKLEKIKELEVVADEIYMEQMHMLHNEKNSCEKLIAWTRVYDSFEDCADTFEAVGKQMEAIILKNT